MLGSQNEMQKSGNAGILVPITRQNGFWATKNLIKEYFYQNVL